MDCINLNGDKGKPDRTMSFRILDKAHDGLAGDLGGHVPHHAGDGLSLSIAVLVC